jgi:hypothetical protein
LFLGTLGVFIPNPAFNPNETGLKVAAILTPVIRPPSSEEQLPPIIRFFFWSGNSKKNKVEEG